MGTPVRKRHAAMVALLVAGSVSTAQASGTLNCKARDANVAFEARAIVSRGMGSGWNGFSAELEIRARGTPAPLARHTFSSRELVHSWHVGGDIGLVLYAEGREGEAFRWVELVARNGRYTLKAFASDDPGRPDRARVYRGRMHCSGDDAG